MSNKKQIEICLTPATYPAFENDDAIVVVTDILRATSAICTAFMNGASKIIPVGTLEKAREYKKQGYMVAAERDGIVRDFADFGNSPFNFTKERVSGKEIVYSTTNGTNSIMIAKNSHEVLVGAFLNLSAIAGHLQNKQKDVIILCAGWKSKFNLEDTLFAGALANELIKTERFDTICDATHASMDLWSIARNNLLDYIEKKAAQKQRLKANNLDDVIEYCCTLNMSKVIPILKEDYLVDLYS